MDQNRAQELSGIIMKVLTESKELEGLEFRMAGGRLGLTECTFNVQVLEPQPDGLTPEGRTFRDRSIDYGLRAEWLSRTFVGPSGDRYQIVGLRTSARQYPVLAVRVRDGKLYKFSVYQIRMAMES